MSTSTSHRSCRTTGAHAARQGPGAAPALEVIALDDSGRVVKVVRFATDITRAKRQTAEFTATVQGRPGRHLHSARIRDHLGQVRGHDLQDRGVHEEALQLLGEVAHYLFGEIVVQVSAKPSCGHRSLVNYLSRRNESNIDVNRFATTDTLQSLFLN